jgi:hypothetical protein
MSFHILTYVCTCVWRVGGNGGRGYSETLQELQRQCNLLLMRLKDDIKAVQDNASADRSVFQRFACVQCVINQLNPSENVTISIIISPFSHFFGIDIYVDSSLSRHMLEEVEDFRRSKPPCLYLLMICYEKMETLITI